MNKLKLLWFILTVSLLSIFVLTTCDGPLGMGLPIDWEAPVVILDPVPNPLYVRNGTVLTGKATDNVGVERIIFIDTATDKELFPVQRNGDNFRIDLEFSEEQNGETILAQIVAYDKMGNSGATSIATVVLYIDIRPPIIKSIDIKRTDTRTADLASYASLKALENLSSKEGGDPDGEKKDYVYKYQNGWFYVNSTAADEETKIEVISLDIYDANFKNSNNSIDVDTLVISLPIDKGYSNYFPRWTVKEEEIINAGQTIFKGNYKTNYYVKDKDGKTARYYYRVVVKAIDKSGNESEIVEEDQGYICLWAKSDEPKGIIDPGIGAIVSRGTPIPVDLYDDDSLLWAYVGLLTLDQWNGIKPICGPSSPTPSDPPTAYVTIPSGTNEEKLLWLKKRLTGTTDNSIDSVALRTGSTVYNWKYDKYMYWPSESSRIDPITELINNKNIDETTVSISTGNQDTDYGDYILFTIAADKKITPHDGKGPEWTNKNIWSAKAKPVQIIDENAPLIVFDTSKGCPEENTFPQTLLNLDGPGGEEKYFKIVGYTLRENQAEINGVKIFRMAWIPYGMSGGPDNYIVRVQEALSDPYYGAANAKFKNPTLEGIQHWDFTPSPEKGSPDYNVLTDAEKKKMLLDEGQEPIDISVYRRQSFSKIFSVMGDSDDLKPETKNFTYKNKLENESKLFVFYAKDNMGHEVFRQLRILGFKEQPELYVYDITNRLLAVPEYPDVAKSIPNPTVSGNFNSNGSPTTPYYNLLNAYNEDPKVISALKGATAVPALTYKDEAIPFQIYPRGTIVKYWVTAVKGGRIGIADVTMKDVTFAEKPIDQVPVGSGYKDEAYSFCEYYPDVTQRTFLFEATDKLGNVKQIQRTIAVTNAARLESITTTTQNGTYGIDQKITLTANFSSQIYVTLDGVQKPFLNIRYKDNTDNYIYTTVMCNTVPTEANPSISLDFEFTVPSGSGGVLETMYDGLGGKAGALPLELSGATKIMDYNRKDEAFIPGYSTKTVTMPNWIDDRNTLQAKKEIKLDGVRPVITGITWGGKTAYSDDRYYFKEGESITLTITTGTGKDIRVSDNPTIQYYILDTTNAPHGPYRTSFKYQKPGSTKKELVFTLPVNGTSCPYNGRITTVTLYTNDGNIVDDVGNTADRTNLITMPASTYIYVKQVKPAIPAATLTPSGSSTGLPFNTAPDTYNAKPTLSIPNSTSTSNSSGALGVPWEDTKQYSLNGGLAWSNYTTDVEIPIGTHKLQTRYIDRAGNEGYATNPEKTIQVNDAFPKLVSVSATQSNGWYTAGKNLEFNLNFADKVRVQTGASVEIKIGNRASGTPTDNSTSAITLTTSTAASTTSPYTYTTTIKFNWNPISNKEMKDGLYIYAINLSGLRDEFGNQGSSGIGVWNGDITMTSTPNYTCPNLPWASLDACIKVDALSPTISSRIPAHDTAPTGDTSITELKITFSENVMKGSGTITIRPRGTYAIPPVLEDTGYYLGTDGNRYSTAGANRTYISSLYDIYNALTSPTHKNYLTQGATSATGTAPNYTQTLDTTNPSLSRLMMNARTGQTVGPYKKTTHGLTSGYGYTGNYSGTASPNLGGTGAFTAMVPDTATKWVLDYQYGITQDITAVNNIRTALTHAKWRWQEIDVVNTSITGSTVTIPLNEPLLKGLEWDVYYPAGAFTDLAGNSAAGSGTTNTDPTQWSGAAYYFTTPGVQPPVIRVNRRSYDARTSAWTEQGQDNYGPPGNTGSWNTTGIEIDDTKGWGIGNFNYVHYRVESESSAVKQGATVSAQYFKGATSNKGAVKGSWTLTENASVANTGATTVNDTNWGNTTATTGAGSWVLSNLIRRTGTPTYNVVTKNGTTESRTGTGTLRLLRSYNRDLTAIQLGIAAGTAETLSNSALSTADATKGQDFLTFDDLEASKSYIIGSATCNGETAKGVEGIFRTVIVFNYDTDRRVNYIAIEGSNIKNGMPSVAGFPVQDAAETGDCRFIKTFYSSTLRRFYWVSTEIVCEWYSISWGGRKSNSSTPQRNGTHQNVGETNNYLMVGYGDLTYGYNVLRYNE